ncbi:hypothetical protein GOV03_01680 [Candidatus Woesearchaeota archaeon]|nr:hypothetical protein [Candidatus Woesearchaeota archaeon]
MAEKTNNEKGGFDLSKIYIWIKGVESKLNTLRREFDVLKEDSSKKYDKLVKEIKITNTDLMDLKREREKFNEKLDLIIKELKLTAGKEELQVLKKYIDLWSPMNFVTQRDVERIVEEKMGKS